MKPAFLLLAALCGTAALSACGTTPSDAPPSVARVDLQRYAGTWYEIAKIPNRFQDHCAGNTTAVYQLRDDGRIGVVNSCADKDGRRDNAAGVARVVDPKTNAKLEVSFVSLFGWQLFWGAYWVVELAPDYSHVIVGHPERRYGWILSRTPTLPQPTLEYLMRRLTELGYSPAAFEATRQDLRPAAPGVDQ